MHHRHFAALTRALNTGVARRRLALLATLPLLGALLPTDDLAAKRKKKKRKCKPKRKAKACRNKCGKVKNNCKKKVNCGPCPCDPPCGLCQTCNAITRQCVPALEGESCGDSVSCVAGQCVCSAASCPAGCCQDDTCHVDDAAACGAGGGACISCGICETCLTAGQCVPAHEGQPCGDGVRCVGGQCVCDAASCPAGCCEGGACYIDNASACGDGGGSCVTCGFQSEICDAGECCTPEGENPESGSVCCAGLTECADGVCKANCCAGVTCGECHACNPTGQCVPANQGAPCGGFGVCQSNGQCWCIAGSCPACLDCSPSNGQCNVRTCITNSDCQSGCGCSGGICGPTPTCHPRNHLPCTGTLCCSNSCSSAGSGCVCSQQGEQCYSATDCCQVPSAQSCIGFVCQQA